MNMTNNMIYENIISESRLAAGRYQGEYLKFAEDAVSNNYLVFADQY